MGDRDAMPWLCTPCGEYNGDDRDQCFACGTIRPIEGGIEEHETAIIDPQPARGARQGQAPESPASPPRPPEAALALVCLASLCLLGGYLYGLSWVESGLGAIPVMLGAVAIPLSLMAGSLLRSRVRFVLFVPLVLLVFGALVPELPIRPRVVERFPGIAGYLGRVLLWVAPLAMVGVARQASWGRLLGTVLGVGGIGGAWLLTRVFLERNAYGIESHQTLFDQGVVASVVLGLVSSVLLVLLLRAAIREGAGPPPEEPRLLDREYRACVRCENTFQLHDCAWQKRGYCSALCERLAG